MRHLVLALLLCSSVLAPAFMPATAAPANVSNYCVLRHQGLSRPRPDCIRLSNYSRDVCAAIGRNADAFGLPRGYFARLIWQESHFNANAVSWAGARGIAQFMPETGRLQGLKNPYNPAEALYRSARYLKLLRGKFGNLGLAAAAYNGGENRVSRFVAGRGYLAAETLDYVQIVTGVPVTSWLGHTAKSADFRLDAAMPFQQACLRLAETSKLRKFTPPVAVVQPWGIQVAQFFSRATAERKFARLQKQFAKTLGPENLMLIAKRNPNFGPALRWTAEVGRGSRKDAQALCTRLTQAGGACIVVRNQ